MPTDTTVASLFDTAYVHPILRRSSLLWDYYDLFIKNMFFLISGTSAGCDQFAGGKEPQESHVSSIFIMKSGKAIPYISAPYRPHSFLDRIRASILNVPRPPTGHRTIDLAPWPSRFSPDGRVHFNKTTRPESERMLNRVIKPDIVVFATGYKQSFPFLSSTSYSSPSSASIRGIFEKSDPSVAFIGFVRPSLGAIPPLSELQAQFWILHLLHALPPPSLFPAAESQIPYLLQRTPSHKIFKPHGVDHESYAYQLAVDMGSAPTFRQVCREGWKVAFTWAMGPNFNSKFRLVGPWRWDGARDVMRKELWDVVKRGGGVVCKLVPFRSRRERLQSELMMMIDITTYTIIPFLLFGSMSGALWVGDAVLNLVYTSVRNIRLQLKRVRPNPGA